jgi:hypothetical protein
MNKIDGMDLYFMYREFCSKEMKENGIVTKDYLHWLEYHAVEMFNVLNRIATENVFSMDTSPYEWNKEAKKVIKEI